MLLSPSRYFKSLIFTLSILLNLWIGESIKHPFTDDTQWIDIHNSCNNNQQHSITTATTTTTTTQNFTMPMHVWTRLKARAALATMGCRSSTFPLREGIRAFYSSEFFTPIATQEAHGYFLSTNPIAFSRLTAVLEARAMCEMAADVINYVTASKGQDWLLTSPLDYNNGTTQQVLDLDQLDAPTWLPCHEKHSKNAHVGLLHKKLSQRFVGEGPLVGISFPCQHKKLSQPYLSTWSALRGTIEEIPNAKCKHNNHNTPPACIQCDDVISPSMFFTMTTQNYNNLHNATPELTTLHNPEQLKAGILYPAPWKPMDPQVNLVQHDILPYAEAAGANNPIALRKAMLPDNMLNHLPATLTAFNVMVSPLGLLQSLEKAQRNNHNHNTHNTYNNNGCPMGLIEKFEEEPIELVELKNKSWIPYIEGALGGKENMESIIERMGTPVRWTACWPAYAGVPFKEWTQHPQHPQRPQRLQHSQRPMKSRVFSFDSRLPDDIPSHPPCTPWDVQHYNNTHNNNTHNNNTHNTVPVYEEVFLLHTPVKSFYWFSLDFIARLWMVVPYLNSNPHVKVHIPHNYEDYWKASSWVSDWMTALNLTGGWSRVISGRIIARIVHLPDRLPIGSHPHPLQLLSLRDFIYNHQHRTNCGADYDDGVPRNDTKTVLVVKRAGAREIANHDELVKLLQGKGLTVTEFGPPPKGEKDSCTLANRMRLWTTADAVIGPHGAGFTNAVAMKPGSLMIEISPQPHSSNLHYMVIAYYARLDYHHYIVPGTKESRLTVPAKSLASAIYGWLTNKSYRHPPQPLPIAQDRHLACLPSSSLSSNSSSSKKWIDDDNAAREPVYALVPFPSINFTAISPITNISVVSYPWISASLKLRDAIGGLAVIPVVGTWHQDLIAALPSQRKLIRFLESKKIMPAALPSSFAVPGKSETTNDDCGLNNQDLLASFQLIPGLIRAMQHAQGLGLDSYIPIYIFGLSSGGLHAGTLASYIRIEGILSQLKPPLALLHHLKLSRKGRPVIQSPFKPGGPCAEISKEMIIPDWLRTSSQYSPRVPPKIWMTAPALNRKETDAIETFATRLAGKKVSPSRIMINYWTPSPITVDTLHAEAPWLVSKAASRIIVNTLYSLGGLMTSKEFDDVIKSYQPKNCMQDKRDLATFSKKKKALHSIALRSSEDQAIARTVAPLAMLHLRPVIVFTDQPRKKKGQPLFYARHQDEDFPKDATPLIIAHACPPQPSRTTPQRNNTTQHNTTQHNTHNTTYEACEVWRRVMEDFLWVRMDAQAGRHNYHESPWAEIVDWLTTS